MKKKGHSFCVKMSLSPAREESLRAMHQLAAMMQMQGKADLATRLHRKAETLEQFSSTTDETREGHSVGIVSLVSVAEMHASRGDYDDAIRVIERALRMEERRLGRTSRHLRPLLVTYASYLENAGAVNEAQSVLERVNGLH